MWRKICAKKLHTTVGQTISILKFLRFHRNQRWICRTERFALCITWFQAIIFQARYIICIWENFIRYSLSSILLKTFLKSFYLTFPIFHGIVFNLIKPIRIMPLSPESIPKTSKLWTAKSWNWLNLNDKSPWPRPRISSDSEQVVKLAARQQTSVKSLQPKSKRAFRRRS